MASKKIKETNKIECSSHERQKEKCDPFNFTRTRLQHTAILCLSVRPWALEFVSFLDAKARLSNEDHLIGYEVLVQIDEDT